MILDNIKNREKYYSFSPKIKAAFEFLMSKDWKNLEAGRYVLNDDIFANLEKYSAKKETEAEYEVHKAYVDIQFVISGEEIMVTGALEDFSPSKPYNEEKDVTFGDCTKVSRLFVKENFFTIFTPDDVHKPCIDAGYKGQVIKVIAKVKLA